MAYSYNEYFGLSKEERSTWVHEGLIHDGVFDKKVCPLFSIMNHKECACLMSKCMMWVFMRATKNGKVYESPIGRCGLSQVGNEYQDVYEQYIGDDIVEEEEEE